MQSKLGEKASATVTVRYSHYIVRRKAVLSQPSFLLLMFDTHYTLRLGTEHAHKSGRVPRPRADLGIVRLGDQAAMRCPEILQFEDDFLEGGFWHSMFAIREGLKVKRLYLTHRLTSAPQMRRIDVYLMIVMDSARLYSDLSLKVR